MVHKADLHQSSDWSATSALREASLVLHGQRGSSVALPLGAATSNATGLGMRPFTSTDHPDVFQVRRPVGGRAAVRMGPHQEVAFQAGRSAMEMSGGSRRGSLPVCRAGGDLSRRSTPAPARLTPVPSPARLTRIAARARLTADFPALLSPSGRVALRRPPDARRAQAGPEWPGRGLGRVGGQGGGQGCRGGHVDGVPRRRAMVGSVPVAALVPVRWGPSASAVAGPASGRRRSVDASDAGRGLCCDLYSKVVMNGSGIVLRLVLISHQLACSVVGWRLNMRH